MRFPTIDHDAPLLERALCLAGAGFAVFPVKGRHGGENPMAWKEPVRACMWADVAATDPDKVRALFGDLDEDHGIGVHCGRSRIVVIDEDEPGALRGAGISTSEAVCVATGYKNGREGERKHHFVFASGGKWGNGESEFPAGVNVRAGNGFVVAPSSPHPSGATYEVVQPEIPALPDVLAALLKPPSDGVDPVTSEDVEAFYKATENVADMWATVRLAKLDGLLEHYKKQPPTNRHPRMLGIVVTAMQEAAAGDYPAEKAAAACEAAFLYSLDQGRDARKPTSGEFAKMVRWGIGKAKAADDGLWSMRPVLGHIRQAAHNRAASPDAVLGAVLARVCAMTPHRYCLPAVVGARGSLNLFVAIVGPVGTTKTTAATIAEELVGGSLEIDGVGISSGEGLVELYMGEIDDPDNPKAKKRSQVKHQAHVMVDEGSTLTKVSSRDGATTIEVLRSAWSGAKLGQANATKERFRYLDRHSYRLALSLCIQPAKAAAILDDADGGLPQRFVWFSGIDKSIPDDPPKWPGPIDWKPPVALSHPLELKVPEDIAAEIRRRHLDRVRGNAGGLDGHADLGRLKLAALFAVLDGRTTEIAAEDWAIAEAVHKRSAGTLERVVGTLTAEARRRDRETTERQARRAATIDAVVETSAEERALLSMAKSAANRVHKHGPLTHSDAVKAMSSKHRRDHDADAALELAVERGWIKADAGKWFAGESKPS